MSTPPILVIKEGTADSAGIVALREAGLLVLIVKDVRDVRYMEPPITPATRYERAARIIAKKLARGEPIYTDKTRTELIEALLADASPPEAAPIDPVAGTGKAGA